MRFLYLSFGVILISTLQPMFLKHFRTLSIISTGDNINVPVDKFSLSPIVSPHCLPLEVTKQGSNQLPNAALIGRHHALQAHHEIPAVLGVEHNQLVLPRGHAHSRHLRHTERERQDTQLNTDKHVHRVHRDTRHAGHVC